MTKKEHHCKECDDRKKKDEKYKKLLENDDNEI